MAHFARVNQENIVTEVIVAEQDFIDSGAVGEPSEWIKTSYNTHGGVHSTGGTPLRKNYAGVGFTYDKDRDAFIPPQPYPSWKLNEESCLWDCPIARPIDEEKLYTWDEENLIWKEI